MAPQPIELNEKSGASDGCLQKGGFGGEITQDVNTQSLQRKFFA
jgi:hypothetical protein